MGCEVVSTPSTNFSLIICISGKRKSGKDYVAHLLAKTLLKCGGASEGEASNCRVFLCGISHPLKEVSRKEERPPTRFISRNNSVVLQEYAKLHRLDHERLKSDDKYKEEYRQEMVCEHHLLVATYKRIQPSYRYGSGMRSGRRRPTTFASRLNSNENR